MPRGLRIRCSLIAGVACLALASLPQRRALAEETKPVPEKVELIPRRILFGNPDKASPRIAPNGSRLAFIAPVDGVLNVWVSPDLDPAKAKPVTSDTKRGIRSYFWAYTNEHILYVQDVGGDEDWHVYAVNLQTGKTLDLTPLKKISAQITEVSHKFPGEILIGLNDRDERLHDLYRVNIETGERKLVEKNDESFAGYMTDDDYHVRFGIRFTPDGGNEIMKPDDKGGWSPFLKIAMEDTVTTNPVGFNKTNDEMYLIDSRGRDTGVLKIVNLETGEEKIIAEHDKVDIGGIMMHPTEKTIQAVSNNYLRTEWDFRDEQVKADFDELRKLADGEIDIASRTLDDQTWVVAFVVDNGPVRYYLYDRKTKQATFLFTNRKELEGLPLVKMHPVVVPARDKLDLVCYLSLPAGSDPDGDGRPDRPLPMVLNVHGGPWARDAWGFDPEHQFLANRGYAVLSVNFRGSTGFGKNFVNAGNKEWAGKMHLDLLDAVDWAVKQKIAAVDKVGIMGGSYGGYATLVGVTMTPDVFACGVDIVGPSNILTLLSTIPPYWEPAKQMFKDRVGDYETEEGKKFLTERSPLTFVDKIKRPLLIGQGANDPRVKQAEADQIVKAMQDKKIPVTYVLFPDEGHGFARPENRLSFYAVTEAFLAEHLGGHYEPIGDAFAGSTIEVPAGASQVPGLQTALTARKDEELPSSDKPAKKAARRPAVNRQR
jgi:dipeptidyl aminopeptidase/acylaminoacyl peptidase